MDEQPKEELVKCVCIYSKCKKVFYAETHQYYCSRTCERRNIGQFFQDRPPPYKPSQRKKSY